MRAELRRVHSPDVPDLASWRPEGEAFGVLLQLMVGPRDSPGEESFDVLVCSPLHLEERARREGPVWVRHTLVVETWAWPAVLEQLERRVTSATGDTWEEVAGSLGRWGRWEFEDYRAQ